MSRKQGGRANSLGVGFNKGGRSASGVRSASGGRSGKASGGGWSGKASGGRSSKASGGRSGKASGGSLRGGFGAAHNRRGVILPQSKRAELLPMRKGALRINRDHKNKNDRYKTVLRWVFYTLTLMLFYGISAGGVFSTWQPVMILPLCAAVAMFEGELASGVFGMFCGFAMDMASGKLFGFTALWLLPCAVLIALLITHLIRVNLINHLWMTAVVCLIVGFMDYVFSYLLWDAEGAPILLTHFILPSYISAAVLAPPIFLLVKLIYARFGAGADREEIIVEENPEQDE